MKVLMSMLLVAAAPALALAQATPPSKPASKGAAPAAAKPTAGKPAATAGRKQGTALAPSARKAVEEATPIEDDPGIQLTDADREVAKQVFVGSIPCELGASVTLTPMKREGFFVVTTKGHRFRMHPVESRTGAIRLEDPRRGAMWLQLGNKSMLMSQKLGQRLADECQSPQQVTFADELKRNPRPSILEPMPVTATPTAAPAAPTTPPAPETANPPAAPPAAPAPPAALPASAAPAALPAPAAPAALPAPATPTN